MMSKHAKIIDELGGPTLVAELLDCGKPSVVGNWRLRGIPWRYRNRVAALAKKRSVALPKDFLDAA